MGLCKRKAWTKEIDKEPTLASCAVASICSRPEADRALRQAAGQGDSRQLGVAGSAALEAEGSPRSTRLGGDRDGRVYG